MKQTAVVEADDPSQLPRAAFQLPQHDEFGFANCVGLGPVWVSKVMNADLYGSVAIKWVNFQGSGNEFSVDLATDVVFYAVNQALPAQREATLIVIELKVFGGHRAELIEIAVVVGIKQGGVEGHHRFV